ncbi:hypothetical protein [Microlunatus endophyticus]|uniref:hypothetical protein n=1 Tax=Microlunatus endophyticus TaxID=1716077 RepID=UPI001663F92E|nr:hypothetical protein [Microlunatus endophyticus]
MTRRAGIWSLLRRRAFLPALFFSIAGLSGLFFGTQSLPFAPQETGSATATVIESALCHGYQDPATATFTVGGTTYRGDVSCSHHVGDRVQICYDPTDPYHNGDTTGRVVQRYGAGLFLTLMALLTWRPPRWLRSRRNR